MLRQFVFSALALGVLIGSGRAALAHPGHSGNDLALHVTIADQAVTFDVFAFGGLLPGTVPTSDEKIVLNPINNEYTFRSKRIERDVRARFQRRFAELCTVEIDGVAVPPLVSALTLKRSAAPMATVQPRAFPPDVGLSLEFPCKGQPRQVRIVWKLFITDPARRMMGQEPDLPLFATIDAYDESPLHKFTAGEPEYIWHAKGSPPAERISPAVVAAEPEQLTVPVASLGIAATGLVAALALGFVGSGRRLVRSGAAVATTVVAAGLSWNVGTLTIASPWDSGPELPSTDEATQIFTQLHRNVYRAFDYKAESDIYDVLAQSVDGPLLDSLYNEVYQSLIMRDQGGAVARVHEVEVLNTDLQSAGLVAEGGVPAFKLASRWRVVGVVQHWGHAHQRTNEYEAEYTIAQRGDNWKITGVDMLAQERIVSPDDDPPTTADVPTYTPARPPSRPVDRTVNFADPPDRGTDD